MDYQKIMVKSYNFCQRGFLGKINVNPINILKIDSILPVVQGNTWEEIQNK